MSVHSSSEPHRPSQLYDRRRDRHYSKPRLRGWMHLVAFELSLVAGTLLITGAQGALRVSAAVIYATSVAPLFGVSALYHRGTWTAAGSARMQRLDHAMILVLIAGTAPPFLIAAHRRRDLVPSPSARSAPAGVRLPRGLPHVRVGGGCVPLHRQRGHHSPLSLPAQPSAEEGSFGIPSTRSAMMLRWISLEPE